MITKRGGDTVCIERVKDRNFAKCVTIHIPIPPDAGKSVSVRAQGDFLLTLVLRHISEPKTSGHAKMPLF